jgi:hypothetical protein
VNLRGLVNRLTPKDPDRFQKTTAGFQSLTLAIGLVVAGVYTGTTFWALGLRERARAELEDLNRRLQHTVLDLRVEGKQETAANENAKYLHIIVHAENKGNKAIVLDLTPTPPLTVARLAFGDEGGPQAFGPPIHASFFIAPQLDRTIQHQVIQPTETYEYNAIVRLREAGVYLIVFDALVTSRGREEQADAPISHWVASTYAVVR